MKFLSVSMNFFGYVHGRVGVRPPEAWKYYFKHGKLPVDVEDLDSNIVSVEGKKYELVLVNERFNVTRGSSLDGTDISRLSDNGQVIWNMHLYPLWQFPKHVQLAGSPYVTIWFDLVPNDQNNRIVYWGIDNQGVCFFLELSRDSGELINKCFLKMLEPVYFLKVKNNK